MERQLSIAMALEEPQVKVHTLFISNAFNAAIGSFDNLVHLVEILPCLTRLTIEVNGNDDYELDIEDVETKSERLVAGITDFFRSKQIAPGISVPCSSDDWTVTDWAMPGNRMSLEEDEDEYDLAMYSSFAPVAASAPKNMTLFGTPADFVFHFHPKPLEVLSSQDLQISDAEKNTNKAWLRQHQTSLGVDPMGTPAGNNFYDSSSGYLQTNVPMPSSVAASAKAPTVNATKNDIVENETTDSQSHPTDYTMHWETNPFSFALAITSPPAVPGQRRLSFPIFLELSRGNRCVQVFVLAYNVRLFLD